MELKRKNKVRADFSIASMTDIIFLLLIFFMITSSAISQSAIDVNLPKAEAQNPSITDPATVTITAEGKYFVNDLETPKEKLEQSVMNLVDGLPNPSFTIKADGNSKHKDVVFAMAIAEKHHYALAIATAQD